MSSPLPPSLPLVFLLDLVSVISGGGSGGNACMIVGCRCLAITFLLCLHAEVSFCFVFIC
ncbi:hypothetical protein B9Z19DRAFT_1077934 [Tuber borchii]|uniref:Uncharacterized protein n=1 Tax=Tuber borchii TaxID=42251 RepID=A0A2T7A0B5_TUBBO|nr:hypothetical protein B9Z19DRAFT_1077934 [Tuber borchii]